jgi:hypothetical protein
MNRSGLTTHRMPRIEESYIRYQPPAWIRPTAERLIAALPSAHLSGLDAIVLTNGAAVGRGKTRRVAGRKYDRSACRGFYHREDSRGSISIVVDNVLAGYPRLFFGVTLFRDLVVARVLFHEIGHHVQATAGHAGSTQEAGAEDWGRRLARLYFGRRYWWLRPLRGGIGSVARWMRRASAARSRSLT